MMRGGSSTMSSPLPSSLSLPQVGPIVRGLYDTGQVQAAELLLRSMLAANPWSPELWHFAGVMAHLGGQAEWACTLLEESLRLEGGNPECLLNLGLVQAARGRIPEAAQAFQRVLALDPDHEAAHRNLGRALQDLGQWEAAAAHHVWVLRRCPGDRETLNNLGIAHLEMGRPAEAQTCFQEALSLSEDLPAARLNLGNALKAQGRFEEALAQYHQVLATRPEWPEARYNLAMALLELGRFAPSLEAFAAVLQERPEHPEALYGAGKALVALGRGEQALGLFRQAVTLSPHLAEAHGELGLGLMAHGLWEEAARHSVRALQIRENPETRACFVQYVRQVTNLPQDTDLRPYLVRALRGPWARPAELAPLCLTLLAATPSWSHWLPRALQAWPRSLDEAEVRGPQGPELEDVLLLELLQSTLVVGLAWERFLTLLRRQVLQWVVAQRFPEELLPFAAALARQCFLNEYVFATTPEEDALVHDLRARVRGCQEPGEASLVALGCYEPLVGPELLARTWSAPVQALLVQQVQEPLEEANLKAALPLRTPIREGTSARVRAQYEVHPYPRWVRTLRPLEAPTLDAFVHRQFPLAPFRPSGKIGPVDILVAGCGTGRQAIELASLCRQARVLALDLSLASLAYGARKARELGLGNVDFIQGDLLEVGALGRTFDFIQAFGVLHHLERPLEGWRALLSVLEPEGILALGLYSELGRQDVVAARDFIAQGRYGSTTGEIRRCRQDLLAQGSRFANFHQSQDFFSTSTCRDLLFHVQEHRITLPQLKELLQTLDLTFSGFQVPPELSRAYRERFPLDPTGTNLDNWHRLETEWPMIFCAMYQFWVQKAQAYPGG